MGTEDSHLKTYTADDLLKMDYVKVGFESALQDNVWLYDEDDRVLGYKFPPGTALGSYEIMLGDMTTSAKVLDIIAQVSRKKWATPKVVGDLVRLVDALLDLQANYCSSGSEQNRTPRDVGQLISKRFN